MRGRPGAVEVRGGELLAAAEAHDALFSFDSRARAAALEIGLPLLPEGEVLFVNLDPRAALDADAVGPHHEPDRNPRPRDSTSFRPRRLPRRTRQSPQRWKVARIGATNPSSPSIRRTPRTTTTQSMRKQTAIRTIAAVLSSPSPSPTCRPTMLRPGLLRSTARPVKRGNSVYFPGPRRADAARAHLQRPLLARSPASPVRALAVRMR